MKTAIKLFLVSTVVFFAATSTLGIVSAQSSERYHISYRVQTGGTETTRVSGPYDSINSCRGEEARLKALSEVLWVGPCQSVGGSGTAQSNVGPDGQKEYVLLEQSLPFVGQKLPPLGSYLSSIFKLGIGLAAVFSVLMIVIGGIEYILGATPFQKGDGKEKIINALTGLLLALAAYLILYTVNPKLTEFNLNLDKITIKPETEVSPSATNTPAQFYGPKNPYNVKVSKLCNGGAAGYTYDINFTDQYLSVKTSTYGPFSSLQECQLDMTNLQASLR
jgi:hypothetical protein